MGSLYPSRRTRINIIPCTNTKAPILAKTSDSTSKSQDAQEELPTEQCLRRLKAALDDTPLCAMPKVPTTRLTSKRSTKTSAVVNTTRSKAVQSKARNTGAASHKSSTFQDLPEPLRSKEKISKYATTSFNRSLKALTLGLRKRQKATINESSTSVSPSKADEKMSKTVTGDGRKSRRHKISRDATADEELQLHAQCAVTAMEILFSRSDDNTQASDLGCKLRQGAMLLLDKLITLKFTDLAITLLGRIHEQYWKRCKTQSQVFPNGNLTDLLVYASEVISQEEFDFVCFLQSQILRLALCLGIKQLGGGLVNAISLRTSGSPACILIMGHDKGMISKDKFAAQLGTISQALLKLCAMSSDLDKGECLEKKFDLQIEALLIEIRRWAYCTPSAETREKLCLQLERAIRRAWGKDIAKEEKKYRHTLRALKTVEQALTETGTEVLRSSTLTEYLVLLAETHNEVDQLTVLLETSISQADSYTASLHLFKLVALQLGHTKDLAKLLDRLKHVAAHTSDLVLKDASELLILVRLRKACYKFVLDGNNIVDSASVVGRCKEFCIVVIRRVLSILRAQAQTMKLPQTKLSEGVGTAILRTVDTIVCMEQGIKETALLEEYISAVDQCSEILCKDASSGGSLTDHGLMVRLSNIYWRLQLRSDLLVGQLYHPLTLAEKSVAVLDSVPLDMLGKAAKGPKLEHIAVMCQDINELGRARSYLLQAIKHYIASGALVDAVETSISADSVSVWTDPSSSATQLARVLNSYIKLCQQEQGPDQIMPYDDERLPEIHRAVLLEYQLTRYTKYFHEKDLPESYTELIKHIMSFAEMDDYAIWRMRLLSNLLHELTRRRDELPSDLVDLVTSQELHGDEAALVTAALSRYRRSVYAILQLQLALLHENRGMDDVDFHIQTLLDLTLPCTMLSELHEILDSPNLCLAVLKAYADRAGAVGDTKLRLKCISARVHLMSVIPQDEHNLTRSLIEMLEGYNEIGDIDAASRIVSKIENAPTRGDLPDVLRISFLIATGNHYLKTSQPSKCLTALAEAGDLYRTAFTQGSMAGREQQRMRNSVIARGVLLASKLAFLNNDLALAVHLARRAAKITISVFTALEKGVCESAGQRTEELSALENAVRHMNISSKRIEAKKVYGTKYWPYIADHLRSLENLALVLDHHGLYTDSLHCRQQADKMLSAGLWTHSAYWKAQLALTHARAGQSAQATEILESLDPDTEDDQVYRLTLCETHTELGNTCIATSLLHTLVRRSGLAHDTTASKEYPIRSVDASMRTRARRDDFKDMKLINRAKEQRAGLKNAARAVEKVDTAKKMLAKNRDAGAETTMESTFRQRDLEDRVLALYNKLELGNGLVTSLEADHPLALLAQTTHIVDRALKQLADSGMTAVLAESAVAIPAKDLPARRRSRVSMTTVANIDGEEFNTLSEVRYLALAARQRLSLARSIHEAQYPSIAVHKLQKLDAKISFLLSTINVPLKLSPLELVVSSLEAKDVACAREIMVTNSEARSDDRLSLTSWPDLASPIETGSMGDITQAQIDGLPASWSVVSIGLSYDQKELLVSKIVSRETPFSLRIPLTRSNESDQEHDFTFATANAELADIVERANETAHDIRGVSEKTARRAWHADREALDNQLKLWLANIESLWFGGFQGVLAPHQFNSDLVMQFSTALDQALNRHLPSRRKTCIATTPIHPHVLGLFLGLGSPNDAELDDALLDLLYFTVDLLHFSGEINAYDEIDFDSLLAAVLDAVSAFHNQADLSSLTPKHTILILDKELESFPFESMSCLRAYPVSRMRTLRSVFRAVDKIRSQCQHDQGPSAAVYTLSKSTCQGAYILNPSLDLSHTQSTFQPILDRHIPSHWTQMVARTPTETEFKEILTSKDLFLYFGHGSGAQYIRGRIIRALPQAPVTFLMGCSSSKMTQYGQYESVGMPNYYQLAGSMAVVGTLWDVTDRDIDRFAVKTLADWGLFDAQDEQVMEVVRLKGRRGRKQREEAEEVARDGISRMTDRRTLIEAVVKGRDACLLRYLCGAAVVVYGVPVTLE